MPGTRMCSGGEAQVFTFSGNVFSFSGEVFTFWGDVFSLVANVFSEEGRGQGRKARILSFGRRRTGLRGGGDVSTLSGKCVPFFA